MKVDRYTTLHRKDERGVIVESRVFGPDDEIPEGFGTDGYQPVYGVREDDQEPVAESVLTTWESPVAKGTWVEQPEPEEVEDELPSVDEEPDGDDGDELSEGSPLQAREEAGGELTEAETEALDAVESDETEDSGLPVPPQGGPGSGKDVWAAYADSKGVEYDDDATRDEIIAACKAAGVPVD